MSLEGFTWPRRFNNIYYDFRKITWLGLRAVSDLTGVTARVHKINRECLWRWLRSREDADLWNRRCWNGLLNSSRPPFPATKV